MTKNNVKKVEKKAAAFLANKSGGAMCAMTDDASFGPVTRSGRSA